MYIAASVIGARAGLRSGRPDSERKLDCTKLDLVWAHFLDPTEGIEARHRVKELNDRQSGVVLFPGRRGRDKEMSFWPKLRKRSRGRRRSGKTNPYASRDVDKYETVQTEHEAQRAQFAAEKGVPPSVVRFISQSSRGWVYLREDTPDSSPVRSIDAQTSLSSDESQQFSESPSPVPIAIDAREDENTSSADTGSQEESPSTSANIAVLDASTAKISGVRNNVGKLILSGKDKAWMQISKTAGVLFVKVLVFSRALGASTAFALTIGVVVDTWNRGKATFHQVFSVVASQLLSTLQPYVSLHKSKAIPLMRAARPQSPIDVPSMKVSPITESSGTDHDELRSSSFAFPVLKRENDSDMSARLFPQTQPVERSPSPVEEIRETTVEPLKESNKLAPTKTCQKLRLKLFKSSPARKSSAQASGENSSEELSTEASDSAPSSPAIWGKRSLIHRKPKKVKEFGEDGSKTPESELKPPKVTRSHELFFRSPQRKESSAESSSQHSPRSVSRSQELRFSLKSFGKRKAAKSQELQAASNTPSPIRDVADDLSLPSSTVESLQELAFPSQNDEEEQRPSSSPQRQSTYGSSMKLKDQIKRRASLGKLIAVESMEETTGSKHTEPAPSSPRGSKSSKASKGCFVDRTVAELKPGLKMVRTTVSKTPSSESQVAEIRKKSSSSSNSRSTPPPSQRRSGELGRNIVMGPDILGALLLLTMLAFLLLGRITAILGTSCFCLVLSHVQAFLSRNLTQRDKEFLRRSSGIPTLRQGSPDWQAYGGSPSHEKADLQSSEYRKRVVMEGLLERGNRRGSTP